MLYNLNLHNAICQLYLNKPGKILLFLCILDKESTFSPS